MKGKSGSVRMKSLDASGLAAMGRHEKRLDYAGSKRAIRDVPPLVYSPYGEGLDLEQSYAAHVEGTKRNKGGRALARHGFLQFPTDLPITPENEQQMLDEAVAFINATHGGRAVFRARLDRDEAGRHGVDVFFAPKYEKKTRRGKLVEDWTSLSKFGKELALERFGERQKKEKRPDSGLFELVFDTTGKPVMERCDSPVFQGRALQDLWTEHLRDRMGLEWVERGKAKVGRDPDRLEPEEYKVAQERGKLESAKADLVREMEAREAALVAREAAVSAEHAKAVKAHKDAAEIKARNKAHRMALHVGIDGFLNGTIEQVAEDAKGLPRVRLNERVPQHRRTYVWDRIKSFLGDVVRVLLPIQTLMVGLKIEIERRKQLADAAIAAAPKVTPPRLVGALAMLNASRTEIEENERWKHPENPVPSEPDEIEDDWDDSHSLGM